MRRLIKRLIVLAIIAACGGALFKALRRGQPAAAPAPAEWPPFERQTEPVKAGAVGFVATEAEEAVEHATEHGAPVAASSAEWALPVDGACPDGFPIKANDNSHIFHVPGGRFYDRTVAERCYVSAQAAERDGYRPSKA